MFTRGNFNAQAPFLSNSPHGPSPLYKPRVLFHNGQPIDLTDGFVSIAQILSYSSATGLYACRQQTVSTHLLYIPTGMTFYAYDGWMLRGNVNIGGQRLKVGEYVTVSRNANVNIILDGLDNQFLVVNLAPIPPATTTQVYCFGGELITLTTKFRVGVDSGALNVSDGDYIWLEQNGTGVIGFGGSWIFKNGAAWPTDRFYYQLAQVALSSGRVVNLNYYWQGGNFILPEGFPIKWTGSSGDPPVYSGITTLAGIPVAPNSVPLNYRDPALSYLPGTVQRGWVVVDNYGDFTFFAFDEFAAYEDVCVAKVTGQDGVDSMGRPCYLITPTQYSLTKKKSPASCP